MARVVASGRMSEEDARARAAAQVGDAERAAVADVVVHNEGSPGGLRGEVDRLWEDLRARAAARSH